MLQWITPLPDQELTDIALHYIFEADPDADSYVLKASRGASMEEPLEFSVPARKDCAQAWLLPEDDALLPPGTWYLQAESSAGQKTSVLKIQVNDDHTKARLKTQITPDHPLICIHDFSDHDFGAEYELLPDDMKPFFSVSGRLRGRGELAERIRKLDERGIPWSYTGIFHGEVVNGRYIVPSLSDLEYILQHARLLTAVEGVEMYMGVRPEDDWQIRLYRRIIMLCGKYGIPFIHSDGNRNDIDLPAVTKRLVFMEILREYHDYVVLTYKQNHANASYSCYGAILGAWIDDACTAIGIQAENWYWNDAGFCDDIGVSHGYLQGNEQQIPAVFSAQMLLPALSLGACYFALEGEGWLIQRRGSSAYEFSPQGIAILSLLRTVIHDRLIPTKEQALERIHAAVDMQGIGIDWGDAWEGGVLRTAFQNLYDIEHTKELFPKQMRYGYLPIVTDRLQSFKEYAIILAEEIQSPDEMNERLNPLYPQWFEGDAYVTQAGKTLVLMNSRENADAPQMFRVAMPPYSLEGSLGLWQYIVAWLEGETLHLHMNARKGSVLELKIRSEKALCAAGIPCRYDLAEACYKIRLEGTDIPVQAAVFPEACEAPYLLESLENRPFDEDFLSDHKPADAQGFPVVDACANLMYGRLPISMNSLRYPHGFSLPRGSSITYQLDKQYRTLEFTYGFDIDVWMPIIVNHTDIVWDRYEKDISVQFRVSADGRTLYEAQDLTSTYHREAVTIDVSDVDRITFEMDGEIYPKPLWCAITGTPDRYLFDASSRDDLPPAEVFLDVGNPVLTK